MSEFVDCRTCKTDCVRNDGNYGYTFCDKHTHPHITNGDRIRSMNDEELAVFVRSIIIAEDCHAPGCDCDKCFFKEPCFNGSKWHGKEIEWLKQHAE